MVLHRGLLSERPHRQSVQFNQDLQPTFCHSTTYITYSSTWCPKGSFFLTLHCFLNLHHILIPSKCVALFFTPHCMLLTGMLRQRRTEWRWSLVQSSRILTMWWLGRCSCRSSRRAREAVRQVSGSSNQHRYFFHCTFLLFLYFLSLTFYSGHHVFFSPLVSFLSFYVFNVFFLILLLSCLFYLFIFHWMPSFLYYRSLSYLFVSLHVFPLLLFYLFLLSYLSHFCLLSHIFLISLMS